MSTESEDELEEFRMDRMKLSVARLTDPDYAVAYWLSRPVEERLQALELARRACNGYASDLEQI